MILSWKSFKIDLNDFNSYLSINFSKTDGIVCTESELNIIETQPLTESEVSQITDYYNSLTESVEVAKIERPGILKTAISSCKNNILYKNYDQMSVVEKKIILNLPLTVEEEDQIINQYGV